MGTLSDDASHTEIHLLLLNEKDDRYTGDESVDIKGNPALKRKTGNWRACFFILGNECCERLAYHGIGYNLVSYLTQSLHEGNISAARSVNTWAGTCYLTPLVGAFLADAYWGRYCTIAVFSTIYFIGMCTLTLSAAVPAFHPTECVGSVCPSASFLQYSVFILGLYLIALGMGGVKPCATSFGADQFDDTDPRERVGMGSFFNWLYFCTHIGALVSSTFIVWLQENVGWGLGFGIPAFFMGISTVSFVSGTRLYRFQKPGGSPIRRMCQVLVASLRKWSFAVPQDSSLLYETSDKGSVIQGSRKLEHTDEFKWLDRAAVVTDSEMKCEEFSNPWWVCTVTQVEELKILIRMFPIWSAGIFFCVVTSQKSTLFVEQGAAMDRAFRSFTIPAASLSTFAVISVVILVPVYDKVLVPIARNLTGKETGFSALQRMGFGLFVSTLAMAAAAVVEIKRLQQATEAVPLSILWQIPQYLLVGAAEMFTVVGKLEFFYGQSPDAMRSLCSAMPLLSSSLGSYLSSFIVTTAGGQSGWIPDNLNEGHLDYFFWLLSGLSLLNLLFYIVFAIRYKEKITTTMRGAST